MKKSGESIFHIMNKKMFFGQFFLIFSLRDKLFYILIKPNFTEFSFDFCGAFQECEILKKVRKPNQDISHHNTYCDNQKTLE